MLSFALNATSVAYATVALVVAIAGRSVYNRYASGLSHIPGPFLASLTDWWRFVIVWGRRPELTHIELHQKHGKLVRIGPRAVSCSEPSAVQVIYALNSGFIKSGFYPVQRNMNAQGKPLHGLFNTTDETFHAKLRRSVANSYAMTTLVQFEPLVDSTTVIFLEQLEQRFADRPGEEGVCDFGTWLQYYAFDVIGELSFSKRFGFVEKGKDIDNIIGSLEWMLDYFAVIGQVPWLDKILMKNPIRIWLGTKGFLNATSPVAQFAARNIGDRVDPKTGLEKGQGLIQVESNDGKKSQRRDFLSRFLEAHQKDPDFISMERVQGLTVGNLFAGSDTTAITLRAIFYNLLRNPSDMQDLLDELKRGQEAGELTGENDLVRWNEVRDLPFLNAVIKEALRVFPAAGLILERIVPSQGIELCGQKIPGGTNIGCTGWTLHRSAEVFGAEPERFRPKRWIEASAEQRKYMEGSLFNFGAGARTCTGKNISLLEMYKLVPAVLQRFKLELADPAKEWKLHNAWFVKQSDFKVRLSRRDACINP